MSARLTPVSGLGAKGPACFLVEAGATGLLLDLGYGPQPETRARTVLPAFGEARHLPAWQSAFAPADVALEGPVEL